ncbi:YHYH protein [Pseudoalteromonas sp. KAN5]|uniref:YHYH protein n=1 Tax=Pseudoalteromonas sp. KAN5 TaxID=2916633 RepID=UPI001FCC3E61|nr:YHYH protein [Pseudoalteromonas sp. KAN5]BDF95108.1 hypothetical protein KAN5_19460 [Pseudoalteromonas sp. KAN5]
MSTFKSVSSLFTLSILCVCLAACNSDSDTSTDVVNSSPVVNAGVDQQVSSGDTVYLMGSVDDDDAYVSILWSQQSGTEVTLSDGSSTATQFIAPTLSDNETLVFTLTVDDGVNAAVSDTVEVLVTVAQNNDSSLVSSWIINNDTNSTYIQNSSTGVTENVQLAEVVNIADVDYMHINATGVPRYDVTMSEEQIDWLNNRPRAATDFANGVTSAQVGQMVLFGEDIGYNSSTENCNDTGGAGYWPPGPGCPTEQAVDAYFTLEPTDNEDVCETGLGTVGLMVNGTSIFNWGDGMSYGQNVWYTLAPIAEQYDVDVCGGHAANGEYHHHFYTRCLADMLNDDGSAHSPIYGFAADGYPLYGPYESKDELALSGWQIRDYGAPTSEAGCATEGQRSCVLIDQYDISQGVESAEIGPAIGELVTTLSGNRLAADAGYYFEDYYYAQKAVAGAQLDEHNGHDTNDGKGYHYHITLALDSNGKLQPSFPYQIGPRFKGQLPENSIGRCSTGDTMGPPPRS